MQSVFTILNPKIQKLLKNININNPTEPQKKAIPLIVKDENVLLIAPTGHGKTESALLPIFHNFLKIKEIFNNENKKLEGISILYITPLRALNRDMLRRTFEWGNDLGINIAVRHGDTTKSERARQSKNPPDMLITTPETLQILFIGKRLRKHLKTVRWVIVDEIHELCTDERGAQLSVALERLFELTKEDNHSFQRIGLSATVGNPKEISFFLGGFENNKFRDIKILEIDVIKNIDIKVEFSTSKKEHIDKINELLIDPKSYAALIRCKELINKHDSTLLFVNTRDGAEVLTSRFNFLKTGMKIGVHHGSLSKNIRIEAEDDFKKGELKALICTSSLELGIDVGNTDFIIQYNSPREVTRMIQRIGRSGHKVGRTSRGIILSTNAEDFSESLIIADKTLKGELEFNKVRRNPLSVLSNQIISIVLEYGTIKLNKIFEIISRSYPFYSLERDIFQKVINQLKLQYSIWMDDEDIIYKRRNSRNYFIDNISMIPDEKSLIAVDVSSRKKIGKLDESFILNYGYEGAIFVLFGKTWTILKIEDEEVLVSQSKELGNAPSWVGEEIPVPFIVANEVGRLRRIATNDSYKNYPCNKKSFEFFLNQLDFQKNKGFIVPDDRNITLDVKDKTVIINTCFGTKVNETIGRIISSFLAQLLGESIGINSDAYRINLEFPQRISAEKIKEIFLTVKPKSIEYILKSILKNSTHIRWHLVHIARKFGALSKDFDYKNVGIKKLLKLFNNSLIFEEAINKIIWEKMDIDNSKKVFEDIQNNKINIHIQGLSPIALEGYETKLGLMIPYRSDRTIIMALKKRLEETEITMICTNCKKIWNSVIRRVNIQPKCSNCGAIKIAVVRRYNKEIIKIIKKKKFLTENSKEIKRLYKNGSIVLNYGKNALMALSARGVGPDTAARILNRYDKDELNKSEDIQYKFYCDILKAEINYARTRGFWDN